MECQGTVEPLLLTPAETAAILGRALSELREWREHNTGPTFHDLGGGLIRYVRESVVRDVQRRAG